MSRATNSPATRKRHKRILRRARGFRGPRSKLIRQAMNSVDYAQAMAYRGRKEKKRQYRRLWTIRINAACRASGISYSRFMNGMLRAGIELDRKVLADLAATDANAFNALIEQARSALAA